MTCTFEDILNNQGILVYTIKGISMLPLLRQNRDLIFVLPPKGRLKKYDIPIFKRNNGEYVVHRILKVVNDGYYIVGDNQATFEFVEDSQIIGVVDRIQRNGKLIPLRSTSEHLHVPLFYKLYTHLWCDLFKIRSIFVRIEYRILQWKKQ